MGRGVAERGMIKGKIGCIKERGDNTYPWDVDQRETDLRRARIVAAMRRKRTSLKTPMKTWSYMEFGLRFAGNFIKEYQHGLDPATYSRMTYCVISEALKAKTSGANPETRRT